MFSCRFCAKVVDETTGRLCGCKKAVYCSLSHQQNDFPQHFKACKLARVAHGCSGYNDIMEISPNLKNYIIELSKLLITDHASIIGFSDNMFDEKTDLVQDGEKQFICRIYDLAFFDEFLDPKIISLIEHEDFYKFYIPIVKATFNKKRKIHKLQIFFLLK